MRPAFSRTAVSRWLAAAVGAALLPGTAVAARPLPPPPPPCGAQLAVRFTDAATDGDAHRMTIVVTNTSGVRCTIAGFPALVLPAAPGDALPIGHVTMLNVVELAPGAPAAFVLHYRTSQIPAPTPCSLSVIVNGASTAADGTIPLAACSSITGIDVTAFANGTHGLAVPPLPAAPQALAACRPFDMQLREVRTAPTGRPLATATYALQNRGAACRIAGSIVFRLLDADAKPISVRYGARRSTAQALVLASGAEASLTAAYEQRVPARCPSAGLAAIALAPDPTPISAPATIVACAGVPLRVSDLRIGVPLPPNLLPN